MKPTDNTAGKLMPNMFARADVVVGTLKDVIAAPAEAVFQGGGGGAQVFRIKSGRVEMLRPTLGPADKGLVAVTAGLAEGDVLAVSGLAGLADGAPVKIAGGGETPRAGAAPAKD